MPTYAEILADAYFKSTKSQMNQLATHETEAVDLAYRSLAALFSIAARVNPVYYGKVAAVSEASGWPMPADSESIFKVEVEGEECAVVPWDDLAAEPSMPSIYFFGGKFLSAGQANSPTNEDLTFTYSRSPVEPTDIDDELDASFPRSYTNLIICETATALALKDGRANDVDLLRTERDGWLRLYIAHLEHIAAAERRRRSQIRRINTNTMVPINQLVAGGASL